tara:strand:- start:427 stop:975 length:549 start_codon:yes stop_codon:yes gene_type:complete
MLYVNPQVESPFQGNTTTSGKARKEADVLREYEQLFIYQMVKEMRKTVPDYGVTNSSQQKHFDEMLDDFLAGEMAKSGQFGIAKQLAEQIALQKGNPQGEVLFPKGISLNPTRPGLAIQKSAPEGLPVVRPDLGLPIPDPKAGIPLAGNTNTYTSVSNQSRALARYGEVALAPNAENENTEP